jgi:hypothetical protein
MPARIIGFIFMYTILLGRALFVKLKRQLLGSEGAPGLSAGPFFGEQPVRTHPVLVIVGDRRDDQLIGLGRIA